MYHSGENDYKRNSKIKTKPLPVCTEKQEKWLRNSLIQKNIWSSKDYSGYRCASLSSHLSLSLFMSISLSLSSHVFLPLCLSLSFHLFLCFHLALSSYVSVWCVWCVWCVCGVCGSDDSGDGVSVQARSYVQLIQRQHKALQEAKSVTGVCLR